MKMTRFAVPAVLFSLLAACAGASDPQDDATMTADDEAEGALTAAGQSLVGAYKLPGDEFGAIVLMSDGKFIHDQPRLLNGMPILGGPPPGRDEGTWSVSAKKKTLTLKVTSGWHQGTRQVYGYERVAIPLNGIFMGAPPAKLVLTAKVGGEVKEYRSTASWCNGLPNISTSDCTREKAHGVWSPVETGEVSCGEDNACEAKAAVSAHCGGIAGFQCPAGTKCVMSKPHYPDQMGNCVPN